MSPLSPTTRSSRRLRAKRWAIASATLGASSLAPAVCRADGGYEALAFGIVIGAFVSLTAPVLAALMIGLALATARRSPHTAAVARFARVASVVVGVPSAVFAAWIVYRLVAKLSSVEDYVLCAGVPFVPALLAGMAYWMGVRAKRAADTWGGAPAASDQPSSPSSDGSAAAVPPPPES